MADGTVKIVADLDNSKFESGLEKLKSSAISGAKVVGTALLAVGTTAVVAGLKYNASIESYQTAFEVMTGSAEKAAEVVANLKKVGAETPFELTDLADTTVLLMNYGLSADDAQAKLMMLGDISQGSAEKMQGIATAYGQMSSAGKVSLEDVKQMIERGFNPLEEISRTTGESMSSLYDRISDGTLSVDEITASMMRSTSEGGRYFQSMDKQSQTMNGKLSTLKDTALQLLGKAVEPLSKKLSNLIIPSMISNIEKFSDNWGQTEQTMTEVAGAVGKGVDVFKKFTPVLAAAGTAMVAFSTYTKAAATVSALSTSFNAAALAVEGYVLANGMSVVSTTASVGALTMKQIVVGLLTGQLTLATAAQMAFNTAMTANPIGLVVAGIAALVAGLTVYDKMTTTEAEALTKSAENRTKHVAKLQEEADAWNQTMDAKQQSVSAGEGEIQNLRQLWAELQTIVDANGQVKAGYESRAGFITSTLSSALGTEITMTDGVIQNYDKMKESIMSLIDTKRAELLLQSQEAAYTQAISDRVNKYKEIQDAQKGLEQTQKSLADAQKLETEAYMSGDKSKIKSAREAVAAIEGEYKKQEGAIKSAQGQYEEYNNVIAGYEGLAGAIMSGNATEINTAMMNITYDLQNLSTMSDGELNKMLESYKVWGVELKDALAKGTEGVDQKMVDDMNMAVTRIETELGSRVPGVQASGQALGQGVATGVGSVDLTPTGANASSQYKSGLDGGVGNAFVSGQAVANSGKAGFGVVNPFSVGTNASVQFGLGIGGQAGSVSSTATGVANSAKGGLNVNTSGEGANFSRGFGSGIGSNGGAATANAGSMANGSKNALSVDTYSSGSFFSSGFARGIAGSLGGAVSAALSLAKSSLAALKSGIQEGSPSKLTKISGRFFGQGFSIGIDEEQKRVEESSTNLGLTALNALDTEAIASKMQGAISLQSSNISTSVGAKVDHIVSSDIEARDSLIDYDQLADAMVDALTSGRVTFSTNEREWATLVKEVR